MAPGKPAVDFNAMINADRKRRKNEALAQEIFSKNRRASAPGPGIANRKAGAGPSLASRIGVTKRTVSTSAKLQTVPKPKPKPGNVDAEWTHDLHSLNNPSTSRISQSRATRNNREARLHNALHGSASSPALTSQFNLVAPRQPQLSIRGLAGPYVVMAKNFALGTTVADIESAMTPVGGVTLGCRIIAERPNVIAEIVFETKEGADNVVETFNNQNADGNILHVYHKIGGATTPQFTAPQASSPAALGPRPDARPITSRQYGSSERYGPQARGREQRREYSSRDDVVDGSYGFDDQMDTDSRYNNEGKGSQTQGRLYSDTIVGNQGGAHRGRGYR